MATESQILANRLNSLKSTGPRTIEGKAVVSQNAVRHGLLAERDVIASESPADFDLYRQQLLDELIPVSPLESMLAERIITLSWRLKRACRFQNQAIDALNADYTSNPLKKLTRSLFPGNHHQSQDDPSASDAHLALGRLVVEDFANARVLDRLLMYERRIENSLYKTLLEFQRLHLIKKMDMESESKATRTLGMSDKRQAAHDTRPATYDTRPATYDMRHTTYDMRPTNNKLCETNPIFKLGVQPSEDPAPTFRCAYTNTPTKPCPPIPNLRLPILESRCGATDSTKQYDLSKQTQLPKDQKCL